MDRVLLFIYGIRLLMACPIVHPMHHRFHFGSWLSSHARKSPVCANASFGLTESLVLGG